MAILKSREEEIRQMVREGVAVCRINKWDPAQTFSLIKKAQKAAGKQLSKEELDFIEKVAIPEVVTAQGLTSQPTVVSPEGGAAADSQKVGGESITPVGVGGEPPKEAVEPEIIEEVSWKDTYNFDKESGEFRLNISKLGGNIKKLVDNPNQLKRAAAVGSSKAAQAGITSWLTKDMTESEKNNPRARVIERGVCNLVDNFISQLFK